MTVKELIEKLSRCNEDAKVELAWFSYWNYRSMDLEPDRITQDDEVVTLDLGDVRF